MTKEDFVIICGDFGGVWDYHGMSTEEANELLSLEHRNYTTLFVDGNHECFSRLNEYQVEMWHGGKVHRITDSVLHLMRGQVFDLQGYRFFTMGGAVSTDRGPLAGNTEEVIGKYWWPEEVASEQEMEEAFTNLAAVGGDVDYVITHALPDQAFRFIDDLTHREEDAQTHQLQRIMDRIKFTHWFAGHYHIDRKLTGDPRFTVCYQEVLKLL